jgi:hypothetical protein
MFFLFLFLFLFIQFKEEKKRERVTVIICDVKKRAVFFFYGEKELSVHMQLS